MLSKKEHKLALSARTYFCDLPTSEHILLCSVWLYFNSYVSALSVRLKVLAEIINLVITALDLLTEPLQSCFIRLVCWHQVPGETSTIRSTYYNLWITQLSHYKWVPTK